MKTLRYSVWLWFWIVVTVILWAWALRWIWGCTPWNFAGRFARAIFAQQRPPEAEHYPIERRATDVSARWTLRP